jgi:hypothetical protein
MRIRFLVAVILGSVIGIAGSGITTLRAQEPVTKRAVSLIDSALQILDMSRRDCSLRADIVSPDNHRPAAISALFSQPLKSFDYAAFYAKALREVGPDHGEVLFARAMSDCMLGTYQPVDFTNASVVDVPLRVRDAAGNELPGTFLDNFTMSYIMRQFVNPVLRAARMMQSTAGGIAKRSALLAQADSLFMMSSEDATASPFELKAAELRGDSIAKAFFDDASLFVSDKQMSIPLSLYKQLVLSGALAQTGMAVLRDSIKTCVIETPYGRVLIGSSKQDNYSGDYLLILDIGGDDRYSFSMTKAEAAARPLRVIIDLSGNDEYSGSSYTLGAGIFGGGLLIDCSGDDSYKAGSFSLGAGLFGVGAVYDGSGNDTYNAGTFAEGAGAFGVGLLADASGNDAYTVHAYGQAFGGTRGAGLLSDQSGNDVYSAVSPFVDVLRYDEHYVSFTQGAALGHRPIAGGGVGVLCDTKGNDTYTADIYGQGSAYWFGYAALIDEAGEDRYQAYQYAQGAGIHFAHGILLDRKGDDVYVSHGVSQGCGHDVGVGVLVDETGDDSYVAESLSLGGGNANAISICVDVAGNDAYIARNMSNCMGYSDFRRSYGLIGIFADGAGTDVYGETRRNASVSTKSTFGVFLDMPEQVASAPVTSPSAGSAASETSQRIPIASSPDSLFVQACTAPQKFQYMVQPARDSLVARPAATAYLARYLGTTQPRERLAMENMMPALYKRDSAGVVTLIKDSLNSNALSTVQFCLWLAGKCPNPVYAPALDQCMQHSDWRIRASAAQNIGEGKYDQLLQRCESLLKDTVTHVRMRAAYTIAQRTPRAVINILKPAINDASQLVRNAVAMGLRSAKPLQSGLLHEALEVHALPHARRSLVRALAAVDTAASADSVVRMIMMLEPEEREAAYREVQGERSALWANVLEVCRGIETDSALRVMLGPSMRSAAAREPLPESKTKDRKRKAKEKAKKKEKIKEAPKEAPKEAASTLPNENGIEIMNENSTVNATTTAKPEKMLTARDSIRLKARREARERAKEKAKERAKAKAEENSKAKAEENSKAKAEENSKAKMTEKTTDKAPAKEAVNAATKKIPIKTPSPSTVAPSGTGTSSPKP